MATAPEMSQFTASLMLFSQTQQGRRYNPHLTRFYTAPSCVETYLLVREVLEGMNVKTKIHPVGPDGGPVWENEKLRLRIGGKDARKEAFLGWVIVEPAAWNGQDIVSVIFQRDQVCSAPIISDCLDSSFVGQSDILAATLESSGQAFLGLEPCPPSREPVCSGTLGLVLTYIHILLEMLL
jgi:hypothetical protein